MRASGPDAAALYARLVGNGPPRARLARHAVVRDAAGAPIDDGVALFFRAPHSATGEDVLELHVHGSPAVARETLLALIAAGARPAQPGEFTRRAFENGKLDLTQAEAVADLIAAEGIAAARAAAARLSGGLADVVDRLAARLAEVLEELSAALDFPDEVESPSAARIAATLAAVRAEIAALAGTWERGRLVREGAAVAIVGPPNAGKSSLLNALLENERALVSEVAGTTRDTIEESLALDGIVVRLIDTAGIRAHADRLEAAGIARSERALEGATLALVVLDAAQPLGAEARDLLARTRGRRRLVYFNKRDLGRAGYDAREPAEADALLGSVREAASVETVRAALRSRLGADESFDFSRPHLGTARQAAAALAADAALAQAEASLAAGAPVDLAAGDLTAAVRALAELTGREAHERLLDGIFSRFCVGK